MRNDQQTDNQNWGNENKGHQSPKAPIKPEKEELHPEVIDQDVLRNSGKDIGLVKAPIISVAPSTGVTQASKSKKKQDEIKILSNVSALLGDDKDDEYPYEKLEIGQGFFLPTQPNSTTDALLAKVHKSINAAKQKYGEVEINEEGDEIWEMLCIQTKKRNDDGTIQLHSDGKPNVGANFTQQPKYNYARNFIAKPVMNEQEIGDGVKADGDGVVVIRVG